eukprot:3329106-Karenia_brevis.AAC.1
MSQAFPSKCATYPAGPRGGNNCSRVQEPTSCLLRGPEFATGFRRSVSGLSWSSKSGCLSAL